MTTKSFDFNALIDGVAVSHHVDVETIEGNPWFIFKDVRKVLGMANHGKILSFLAADEQQVLTKRGSTSLGRHGLTAISESGLYKFLMRSDKPAAKPFQDWVTREVLPNIRKTGAHILEAGETMPLPANFTSALRQHAATLIKLAEEQEAHAVTEGARLAAMAAKAQAESELVRVAPLVAVGERTVLRLFKNSQIIQD